MSTPIFCSCFFPSIEYLQNSFQFEEIQMEYFEFYPKQTLRNRCFILSPNGVQSLIVPIQHSGGKKILMKDVKISYEEKWQHQHWRSLEAAYNRSAFFEFYRDELEKILLKENKFLVDLNEQLLLWLMQKLKINIVIKPTESFCEDNSFQPISNKKNYSLCNSSIELKSYPQVFSYKFGFVNNLSGIDLLFNMGNASTDWLK